MENLLGCCPVENLSKACDHQYHLYNGIGGKLRETNRWIELVEQKLGPALIRIAHIAVDESHQKKETKHTVHICQPLTIIFLFLSRSILCLSLRI